MAESAQPLRPAYLLCFAPAQKAPESEPIAGLACLDARVKMSAMKCGYLNKNNVSAKWRGGFSICSRSFSSLFPGRRDPALRRQPVKSGIQRSCLDLQQVFGCPLNMFRDRVAMGRSDKQSAQYEEIVGALEDLDARGRVRAHCVDIPSFFA